MLDGKNQHKSHPYKQENIHLEKLEKRKHQCASKIQFKGITLKEYFRLCDQTIHQPMHRDPTIHQPMHPIQEENNAEDKLSNLQTPSFGQHQTRERNRHIIKTQAKDQHQNQTDKNANYLFHFQQDLKNKPSFGLQDLNSHSNEAKMKQKKSVNQKSKRLVTHPSKNLNNSFTKTSVGSFYYLNEKKEKMLDKIRAEKERVKSLRLNEIFLVTKYASKFKINAREVMK